MGSDARRWLRIQRNFRGRMMTIVGRHRLDSSKQLPQSRDESIFKLAHRESFVPVNLMVRADSLSRAFCEPAYKRLERRGHGAFGTLASLGEKHLLPQKCATT